MSRRSLRSKFIVADIEGVSSCPVLICLRLSPCPSVFVRVFVRVFLGGKGRPPWRIDLRFIKLFVVGRESLGKNDLGSSHRRLLAGGESH